MADEMPASSTDAVDREHKQEGEAEVTEAQEQGMSLIDHLQEFRMRILISVAAVMTGTAISWFYAGEVVDFLIRPVGKLIFLNPGEAFFTYLKVAVFMGVLMALPVIMHQIWAFVVPALHESERKVILMLGPASVILFFTGIAFSYYLVLPTAVKFFMGFATEQLQPLFSLGPYISFIISFLFPFGLVFELPLCLIVLARMGMISSHYLISKRKVFLVLAFVIGALAAPTPDVFSQVMVALPLLLLYEMSIFVIKKLLRR